MDTTGPPQGKPRRRGANRLIKPAIFLAALLPFAFLAWDAAKGDLGANPIEEVEHRTGRWALYFLLITLAVSPIRRLGGWNAVIRLRRMLGLFAFFYATLHVSAFIGLDMFFDWGDIVADVIERPWITIGMLSWLLLVPLAITSTKGWIRRLGGRRWNLLHRLAYVAASGGTIHYYLAVKQDVSRPVLFGAILVLLLGVRIAWRFADAMKAR
ncbi:MAG TPA: protein-methionine-sulfoxide reductase heme-binding subunit MsrQ [Gemmatimonadaceae bacterium]|nr:protein-methionine-sulfoxide reductase heme-binding subunit MsrQ [Gemmatimonadaceae bacterium]